MRSALLPAISLLLGCMRIYAAQEKTPNIREVARLEARAARAELKEQCFLYAKLVRISTDLAAVQMQAGDEDEALMTLQSVQGDAARIDPSRSSSVKKLKNAEILLGQAAFKLKELLMDAPLEDRPPLEKTLKRVNEAQSALLLQVFEH